SAAITMAAPTISAGRGRYPWAKPIAKVTTGMRFAKSMAFRAPIRAVARFHRIIDASTPNSERNSRCGKADIHWLALGGSTIPVEDSTVTSTQLPRAPATTVKVVNRKGDQPTKVGLPRV